jgi:hypothetical protein
LRHPDNRSYLSQANLKDTDISGLVLAMRTRQKIECHFADYYPHSWLERLLLRTHRLNCDKDGEFIREEQIDAAR